MDRRTLIALIIATLISCIGYAGESGYFLNLRGATDTYRMPLYLYREDVEVATAPLLVVQLGGRARYGRLIPSSSATASEPFRVKYSDIFISDVFTLSATSPYSIEYTDEKYFTFTGDIFQGSTITGYNTTFGPLDVLVPPVYIGVACFHNSAITSADVSNTKGVGGAAFKGSQIATITIPAQWSLGDPSNPYGDTTVSYCFAQCPNLRTMIIQGYHQYYPQNFAEYTALTQLNIPWSSFHTTVIESGAFDGASRVTFEGPYSAYQISDYAFSSGSRLKGTFAEGGSGTYSLSGTTWTKE
jgi:hypothetical protein